MGKIGFDCDKYIELQTQQILKRIEEGDGAKLYLEFGGKLTHDKHAMRVLPGFDENAKIKLLKKLSDKAEVILCVYAGDIATNKTRQDFGITYDLEALRLIDDFRKNDLEINSVVVTRYEGESAVDVFINKLNRRGVKTYKHTFTKGYPTDVETIVSEEGYGANPYIETTKPLVVVTGPGGGSGKLATCLSQMYHEYTMGKKARYAKFETFPIWNIPLKHPVNVAYEAATADLKDVNMIDSFHLEAYGETTVNYNRDVEAFPVVKRIMENITGGECEYKSPTDMGVNMVGYGIIDDDVCREAAKQEIIRRVLIAQSDYKKGLVSAETPERISLLMEEVGAHITDRKVVQPARDYAMEKRAMDPIYENVVVVAIELDDGRIITGRSSSRMVAGAAAILNAVKVLGQMADNVHLISPNVLSCILNFKKGVLQQERSNLSIEEVLNALAISSSTNPSAEMALTMLPKLRGCKAHSTAILNEKDEQTLADLGIDLTCDAEYSTSNLYYRT